MFSYVHRLVVPVARLEAGDIVRDIVAACKQHLLRHLSLQWISVSGFFSPFKLKNFLLA